MAQTYKDTKKMLGDDTVIAYIYGSKDDPKPEWFDESTLPPQVKQGDVIICNARTKTGVVVDKAHFKFAFSPIPPPTDPPPATPAE